MSRYLAADRPLKLECQQFLDCLAARQKPRSDGWKGVAVVEVLEKAQSAMFEMEYAQQFDPEMGAPAKTFRLALGILIIKEKLGTSDRETIEQIRENPYLQYFIGREKYSNEAPCDESMLVHFRKRIGAEVINKINKRMVEKQREVIEGGGNQKK